MRKNWMSVMSRIARSNVQDLNNLDVSKYDVGEHADVHRRRSFFPEALALPRTSRTLELWVRTWR